MKYKPRPYQEDAIARIREAWREGVRRICLVSPTGGGKTVVSAQIIEGAVAKGNRVLFLAHRKELLDQCSRTLDEIGVDHGVIKSGHWRRRPSLPVQVASIQTITASLSCPQCKDVRRQIRATAYVAHWLAGKPRPKAKEMRTAIQVPCDACDSTGKVAKPMPQANVVVIDEGHRCLAPMYQQISDQYSDALLLALTATPWRLDGRGLGSMYQRLVATVQMQELVDEGFLLPIRAYGPDSPDMSGVKTSGGDYDSKGMSSVMGEEKLVGNIIDHWLRLGEDRQTVAFAASVENSKHLVDRFSAVGVAVEHIDGTTPDEQRAAILKRFADGTTRIVTNVDILIEGYDLPSLGCVVLARPTKSLTRYLQMVGRGMRPYPGQDYMILLDHAGCWKEHGPPTAERRWSLEDRKQKSDTTVVDENALNTIECSKCGVLRPATQQLCPKCHATQIAVFSGLLVERDEDLVELHADSGMPCPKCESVAVAVSRHNDLTLKLKCYTCGSKSYTPDKDSARQASDERRRSEFDKLVRVQRRKGYKPGWVSYRYREIFGGWPPKEWTLRVEDHELDGRRAAGYRGDADIGARSKAD